MPENDPLPPARAAHELGISVEELLSLVHEHKIRYVMVNGMPHISVAVVREFRARNA